MSRSIQIEIEYRINEEFQGSFHEAKKKILKLKTESNIMYAAIRVNGNIEYETFKMNIPL